VSPTYVAWADPPLGFNYGEGHGKNDPINCKHCGEPLIYLRPGDWYHAGPSYYVYCDRRDQVVGP
jgi:hypothetical protein